jgi:hypothetical protein
MSRAEPRRVAVQIDIIEAAAGQREREDEPEPAEQADDPAESTCYPMSQWDYPRANGTTRAWQRETTPAVALAPPVPARRDSQPAACLRPSGAGR